MKKETSKTWYEWVEIVGGKEGWTTSTRDFGSGNELMTEKQFKESMRGQTVTLVSKEITKDFINQSNR